MEEISPFSKDQIDNYRERLQTGKLSKHNESVLTHETYRVYSEILDKVPTSHSMGSGINSDQENSTLTDLEKQVLKEELGRIQSGPTVQVLDVDGDTSLQMIHMVFQFFLQSAQYGFFIKRVKNIAQFKLSCDREKTRIMGSKVSASHSSKPLRQSPRRQPPTADSYHNKMQDTVRNKVWQSYSQNNKVNNNYSGYSSKVL